MAATWAKSFAPLPRKIFFLLLLVTRPEPSASETAAQLGARGYAVLVSPALVATPLPPRDLHLTHREQLLVTSPQAARFLRDWTHLHNTPVWAVGTRTAALLRTAGFRHVIHNGSEDAQSLAAELAQVKATSFCSLGAPSTGRGLQQALQIKGKQVRRVNVYRITEANELSAAATQALTDRTITHMLFYSARTARAFLQLTAAHDLRGMTALCLSAAVATTLDKARFAAIAVAARPTAEALQALLPALD